MQKFDESTPIYLQIAEDIREGILTQSLKEGERIMSTNQYASTYKINPATANKAMTLLVDEGLIYKQRGIGMFVAEGAHERLLSSRRETFYQDEIVPLLEKAEALGYNADSLVRLIQKGGK